MVRTPIRDLRKQKGLTQRQLADRLGVTATAVANWEQALYEPSAQYLPKLAAALGVRVERIGWKQAEAAAEVASRKAAVTQPNS